ncbi:MAG: hypothetical protein ACJAZ3_001240 [Sphingobacteriales bacterium]|jgi:hypothetical protein
MTKLFRVISTLAPIRAESKEGSEMISQLLFGELMQVEELGETWSKVICDHDNYPGYISTNQIAEATKANNEFTAYAGKNVELCFEDGTKANLSLGTPLVSFEEMKLNSPAYKSYQIEGNKIDGQNVEFSSLHNLALQFLHTPYLWGGRSEFGIDCSGFVQNVYRMVGVNLPRDASQQVKKGELVIDFNDQKLGDLAFFKSKEGKITHVGIILQDQKIIHSSGMVRIDDLTEKGIVNGYSNKLTHHLDCIKSLV